jgi:transposase
MFSVGIDLHKKVISLCVVNQVRAVVQRKRLHCSQPEKIREFFKELGAFQAVIEATASYEWLWQLLEPLAQRLVLAHPKKLRVIAESTRKSDRLDAQVLAEFLALDMIPEAYRPTPRQRQHRMLVRQRFFVRKRIGALKNKIRHLISAHNSDRSDLFSSQGQEYLAQLPLPAADRFVLEQLLASWRHHEEQLQSLFQQLKAFAKSAPQAEQEARAVLESIPQVGPVTVDVVVSELGDVRRFRSAKRAAAYAGLAPGQRESAGHKKELPISKEGSRLLRWVLVESAWRVVQTSRRWATIFENLRKRRGKKKAVVAVARRLLGVMVALLRTGQSYRPEALCS